jgi:hypothetical protein
MSVTPYFDFALPVDGQTPWGGLYRSMVSTIDSRLPYAAGTMYASDRADVTTIGTQGVWQKANVVTTFGPPCPCFTHTANRMTFVGPNGATSRRLTISVTASLSSAGNAQTLRVGVSKNGQDPEPWAFTAFRTGNPSVLASDSLTTLLDATGGDFFEVWVRNDTSTSDVTFVDLAVTLRD